MNKVERAQALADLNERPSAVGPGPGALEKRIRFFQSDYARDVIAYGDRQIIELHLEGQGSLFPVGAFQTSVLANPHFRAQEEFDDLSRQAQGQPPVDRVNILDLHAY
jgi:hypothetical protein